MSTRTVGTIFAVLWAAVAVTTAWGVDLVEYVGAIDVGMPLGRIVADPNRPQIYGITEGG